MRVHQQTSSHAAVGISVQDIAEAALRLVRERGVDRLTMRAVAAELGVRAPTLYHHVATKARLLDLVAQQAFRSFTSLTGTAGGYAGVSSIAGWIDLVRANSLHVRDFYLAHPGLAAAVVRHGDPRGEEGAGRPDLEHDELDALVRLGVPAPRARRAVAAGARWTVAAIMAEGSPHSDAGTDEQVFLDGLDLLLAGMRDSLQEAAATAGEAVGPLSDSS